MILEEARKICKNGAVTINSESGYPIYIMLPTDECLIIGRAPCRVWYATPGATKNLKESDQWQPVFK